MADLQSEKLPGMMFQRETAPSSETCCQKGNWKSPRMNNNKCGYKIYLMAPNGVSF